MESQNVVRGALIQFVGSAHPELNAGGRIRGTGQNRTG